MMFKDDHERQAAIQHLPTLKDHPAWKFIERALDENIEHFTNQLRTRKDFESVEEIRYLQDCIAYVEAFKVLPETVLKAAQDKPLEPAEENPFTNNSFRP